MTCVNYNFSIIWRFAGHQQGSALNFTPLEIKVFNAWILNIEKNPIVSVSCKQTSMTVNRSLHVSSWLRTEHLSTSLAGHSFPSPQTCFRCNIPFKTESTIAWLSLSDSLTTKKFNSVKYYWEIKWLLIYAQITGCHMEGFFKNNQNAIQSVKNPGKCHIKVWKVYLYLYTTC